MNLTEKVLNLVNQANEFPVVITNREVPIIEESALIIQALEGEGYQVETFVDIPNQTYGIKVTERQ